MHSWWRALFRRRPSDSDLQREIDFHLQMRHEEYIASGMDSMDARGAAIRQFGNRTRIGEDMRGAHINAFRESVQQDVRFAWRSFRRTPLFTITVVLTMAAGIGCSTAVFSVVDRLLFRSLAYPEENRLVSVGVMAPLDSNEFVLAADFADWKKAETPFESLGSYIAGGGPGGAGCDLTEVDPRRLNCAYVDSAFLPTLGVSPLIGRNFSAEEDLPDRPPVGLISFALWRSRFALDPSVVGETLFLNEKPVRVIGVLPASFEMPALSDFDVLLPQALDPATLQHPQTGVTLRAFGRLKPGWTLNQARAAMQPLFEDSLHWVPAAFRAEVHLQLRPLRDRQIQGASHPSWVLFGAVMTVLLIACANCANLLLARGAFRRREMALRAALGAGKARLMRQVITESLLLAGSAGLAGCLIAWWCLRLFVAIAPAGIPRLAQASLDFRVLAFAAILSLACGLLFGLAPAMQSRRLEAVNPRVLGSSSSPLRHTLVAFQIAASLVLMSAAGLLTRSLWNFESLPLGMRTEQLVTASMVLGQKYNATPARLEFYRAVEDRLRRMQAEFTLADSLPLVAGGSPFTLFASIEVEGRPRALEGTGGTVTRRTVSEGFFSTLGIPLVRGRAFNNSDRSTDASVVILSEALARRLFSGDEPLGKRMRWGFDGPWRTIVGIAGNVKNNPALAASDDPEFYLPRQPLPAFAARRLVLALRTSQPVASVQKELRAVLRDIDPVLPVEIETMNRQVSRLVDRPRFNAALLGGFSLIALLLAAVGLFGVVSFLVAQRTAEIGLRFALGARTSDIRRLILSQAARWIALGTAVGLIGALAAVQTLQSLLFQVSQRDLPTLAAMIAMLVAVAVLAAWIPCRRATRVDPCSALRHD